MQKQTRYQKEMTANTELIRINEVNISQEILKLALKELF